MKSLVALLFIIILFHSPVNAEIYNCDGKWTNRPCSGTVAGTIQEKPPSSAPAPVVAPKAPSGELAKEGSEGTAFDMKRYEMIKNLRRANEPKKTGSKGGIDRSEVEAVARLCSDQSHSNEECTEAYSAAMKKIESTEKTAEDVLLGNTE